MSNSKCAPKLLRLVVCLCFVNALSLSLMAENFREFIAHYCVACHDGPGAEGGLDLGRFTEEAAVMKDRGVWGLVYDKLESRQMPPPKEESQPTEAERAAMLAWIEAIASRPDPVLGVRDPGKPILRRLTRLEYNNVVRDLFGLDIDVFMFPERLPIVDKGYFQPAIGKLDGPIKIMLREYGGKYPVLCPQLGLPGDNRAEHGYRNRGDAMDFSQLLLEKYLAAAQEIVNAPELPVRSAVAADLFGIEPETRRALAASLKGKQPVTQQDQSFVAADQFAPRAPRLNVAARSADPSLQRFRDDLRHAFSHSVGGLFDAGDTQSDLKSVPGKGGLVRVRFADQTKTLTINPNVDLWLVGFSTAQATSGGKLFCNRIKGEKTFELTLRIEDGKDDEGVSRLAVCILGRKQQSGQVSLTAKMSDGTEDVIHVEIPEGVDGSQFVSFRSVPGETIRSLVVDGSQFSGDYVLLDDLAFITNGTPRPMKSSTLSEIAKVAAVSPPAKQIPTFAEPQTLSRSVRLPPISRLTGFMERAFRRSVSPDEVRPFVDLFNETLQQKNSEPDAMRTALAAVLASPQFLFIEANGATRDRSVVPLEDAELATRLALFLWASMPDDELLQLAKAGRLHDPAILEEQTRRMLRDPRSHELSESFASQWLRLDQLYTAKPDRDLFKEFYSGPQGKSTMHGSMLMEALLLFETVHVEDRSILDFMNADFTWLNPGMAKIYDIPLSSEADIADAVSGSTRELKTMQDGPAWRRVRLSDARRGGFMTMAAPLVVTSLPFRTSPVKRGAWLLETAFNRPPTEPKIAFVIENDTKEGAQQMSIRQKFEAHRSQAACYSCHVRLDPPGFALEHFGPIGQWRETDGNQTVDAKGDWLGEAFDGPAEFKAILARQPHEFTRGFIEHLLSYALGRELAIYDMPAVAEIEHAVKADGYRFSRVLVEIAKSYPFTHTRGTQQ